MKKILIPLFLFTMVGSAWADSARTETGADNRVAARGFKSLDLNNDGAISREEAASNGRLTKEFDKVDSNKDGRLEFGEYAKYDGSVETNIKGANTPLDKNPKE